jgi:hypothetical protein
VKNLVILTPAVIDKECIASSQESLFENLVLCNKDVNFLQLVHLDNHKRKDAGDCSIEDAQKIYIDYSKKAKNYGVQVISPTQGRVGLIQAGYMLFGAFLNADSNLCFIFEDDTTFTKKISLSSLEELLEPSINMLHLSFGVMTENGGYSTEEPFVEPEISMMKKTNEFAYSDRDFSKRPSFTWNGTFFTKKAVANFLPSYQVAYGERFFPEDQIGRFFHKLHKSEVVRTVFFETRARREMAHVNGWRSSIHLENHMVLDEIRYKRGHNFHGALR